jgi:universal stress protein A
MGIYQHILLAVDFSSDAGHVGNRAVELARLSGARLTLLHVVAPVYQEPLYEGVTALPLDLEEQLVREAVRSLDALAQRLGVPEAERLVEIGSPKGVILSTAAAKGADLIVVGSHGVHGLGLLLGSTANAVLHGALCDVLAVRVPG